MTKAINQNITRRAALKGAAAMIPATAIPALALAIEPDPIFAAIEEHRTASLALRNICEAHTEAEDRAKEIFQEVERTGSFADLLNEYAAERHGYPLEHLSINAFRLFHLDKIKNQRGFGDLAEAMSKASTRQSEVQWRLVEIAPTTLAGVAALLRYVAEFEATGDEWAPPIEGIDGERVMPAFAIEADAVLFENPFHLALHRNCANVLEQLAA